MPTVFAGYNVKEKVGAGEGWKEPTYEFGLAPIAPFGMDRRIWQGQWEAEQRAARSGQATPQTLQSFAVYEPTYREVPPEDVMTGQSVDPRFVKQQPEAKPPDVMTGQSVDPSFIRLKIPTSKPPEIKSLDQTWIPPASEQAKTIGIYETKTEFYDFNKPVTSVYDLARRGKVGEERGIIAASTGYDPYAENQLSRTWIKENLFPAGLLRSATFGIFSKEVMEKGRKGMETGTQTSALADVLKTDIFAISPTYQAGKTFIKKGFASREFSGAAVQAGLDIGMLGIGGIKIGKAPLKPKPETPKLEFGMRFKPSPTSYERFTKAMIKGGEDYLKSIRESKVKHVFEDYAPEDIAAQRGIFIGKADVKKPLVVMPKLPSKNDVSVIIKRILKPEKQYEVTMFEEIGQSQARYVKAGKGKTSFASATKPEEKVYYGALTPKDIVNKKGEITNKIYLQVTAGKGVIDISGESIFLKTKKIMSMEKPKIPDMIPVVSVVKESKLRFTGESISGVGYQQRVKSYPFEYPKPPKSSKIKFKQAANSYERFAAAMKKGGEDYIKKMSETGRKRAGEGDLIILPPEKKLPKRVSVPVYAKEIPPKSLVPGIKPIKIPGVEYETDTINSEDYDVYHQYGGLSSAYSGASKKRYRFSDETVYTTTPESMTRAINEQTSKTDISQIIRQETRQRAETKTDYISKLGVSLRQELKQENESINKLKQENMFKQKQRPKITTPNIRYPGRSGFNFPEFRLPKIKLGTERTSYKKMLVLRRGYSPSIAGILSGKTIFKAPKGTLTGIEIRYPVRNKRKIWVFSPGRR